MDILNEILKEKEFELEIYTPKHSCKKYLCLIKFARRLNVLNILRKKKRVPIPIITRR
jgi:hypothetical protein